QLSDPGPIRVHDEEMEVAAVAVAREQEPAAVGRPACAVAFVPTGAVGQADNTAAIRIHDIDLFVAVAETDERDLSAAGRPGGWCASPLGELGHPRSVRIHDEDFSVRAAERDPPAVG